METEKRTHRLPNRFGAIARRTDFQNLGYSSDEDIYNDNPFDDLNYVPEEGTNKRKVVATISRPTKKLKTERLKTVQRAIANKSTAASKSVAINYVNLYEEFEHIVMNINEKKNSTHQDQRRQENEYIRIENSKADQNSGTITPSQIENVDKENNAHVPGNMNDIFNICNLLLNRFESCSKEWSARISILEEAMLNGSTSPVT